MDAEQWRRVSAAFIFLFVHELRLEEDINSLEMATDEERPVALPHSLDLQADAVPVAGPTEAFMWVCTPVVTHSKPELTGTLLNAIAMGVATTNPTISPSWIQGRVWRLGLNEFNSASIGLLAAGSGWSELQLSSMCLRPWCSHCLISSGDANNLGCALQ